MIFLGFLLPLAIYLLIVASLNNREHPLLVSGLWDFAGILFGASGFIVFGGPAILGNFSERARLFWMLGERQGPMFVGDVNFQFWILLSVLYFVIVVGGSAYLLWQHRAYTSIYNIELGVLERALNQACLQAGASPVRSGNQFLFDMGAHWASSRAAVANGMQTAPFRGPEASLPDVGSAGTALGSHLAQNVVVEVDAFPGLRHATLRWGPAHTGLRIEIEGELRRILNQTPPPDYVVSFWATVVAQGLFVLIFVGALLILILRMLSFN